MSALHIPPMELMGMESVKCVIKNRKWGQWSKGSSLSDEIRSGCLTPALSGAQKRAEVLRNPYVLGGPQTRGQNQKWLPHPCLVGGPKEGGSAT